MALMSNVLGVLRGYIVGYAKQSFFAFRRFSILVKFDCFATLYKSLSVWAEALKAPSPALTAMHHSRYPGTAILRNTRENRLKNFALAASYCMSKVLKVSRSKKVIHIAT